MAVKKLFPHLVLFSSYTKNDRSACKQRVHRTARVVPVTSKAKHVLHSKYLIQPIALNAIPQKAYSYIMHKGSPDLVFSQKAVFFKMRGSTGYMAHGIYCYFKKSGKSWEYFNAMCHFPQGFIITLLNSVGALTLTLKGIIFHSEFSDADLIKLKFQHVIFPFVKRKKKKKPKLFHSHRAN